MSQFPTSLGGALMDEKKWRKSTKHGHAILLFGRIEKGHVPNNIWPHFGSDAYEMYQLAVYIKELINVRTDPNHISLRPGFGIFYSACAELVRTQGSLVVEEIGSTLFVTIDKLEKLGGYSETLFRKIKYRSVEVVKIFSDGAAALHPGRELANFVECEDLPCDGVAIASLCYQATSYALDSTDALCKWVMRSAFSSQGVWFSNGDDDQSVELLGKSVTLFSWPRFRESLLKAGLRIVILENQNKICEGHEFSEVWLFTFKPWEIEMHVISNALLRDFGRELPMDVNFALPNGGPLIQHGFSLGDMSNLAVSPDPTFNFGGSLLDKVFENYLSRVNLD